MQPTITSSLNTHNQPIDVYYEIMNNFMRKTGDKLINQELKLMADSSTIIDSLLNIKKIPPQLESTADSLSPLSRISSPESKLLSRKSPRGPNKTFNFSNLEQLKDIESNCSTKTVKWIRQLMREHQKIKELVLHCQNQEKRLKRSIQNSQKQHEQLLIAKQIAQEDVKKLETELNIQRRQLLNLNKGLNPQSHNYIKNNVETLTTFLDQKQKAINCTMERAMEIENNVIQIMETQVKREGQCQRCCLLMKKMKEVINKLRKSLKQQSDQIQILYNQYKQALLVMK